MIKELERKEFAFASDLITIACLSTDTKPTVDVATGSKAYEIDTSKTYMFDEESGQWRQVSFNGGGGGGSSEVGEAIVTVNNITGEAFEQQSGVPNCREAGPWGDEEPIDLPDVVADFTYFDEGVSTYKVPLYNGTCFWVIDWVGSNPSVSGDIENIGEESYGVFLITGDGTITMSN